MTEAQALPGWAMANSVTAFATLGAGVYTLILWAIVPGQPLRWAHAYLWIFLTGIPTLGLHGYGEPFAGPSHPYWAVADTGSNLVLAWALQVAVLGDFFSRTVQWRFALASGLVNLAGIANMVRERFFADEITYLVPLGEFGGFRTGETMLILDSILVVGLLYASRGSIPRDAKPLLNLTAVSFLVGLGLATASNDQIGMLLGTPTLAYHALWHLVGAFGFMVFFLFNHVRFNPPQARS